MKTGASLKNRQGGAVAVMVGISIVLLVGFLALVLDLGHVYVAKTELQNAADAAALSGAKELDGTAGTSCTLSCTPSTSCTGVTRAVCMAIATAGENNYDFSNKVDITSANISVGSCPLDTCMVPASSVTSDAAAADKTFLKVDTGPRQLGTWVAPIFNLITGGNHSFTRTFGMAVAGRYLINVAPLGVCAVDKYRWEQGFIRGVAYNVPQLNPLIINADPLWINPVNAPPDTCADVDPQWNSRDKMAPFVCTGKSAVIRALPGWVFVNTGQTSALQKEFNSRFDDYQGSKCSVTTAPPDTNVKEYQYNASAGSGGPRDWMEPGANVIPSQQGITITNRVAIDKTTTLVSGAVRTPPAAAQFGDYGALWSYSREKNFGTGMDHTLDDWCGETNPLLPCSATSLYKGRADQTATTGYPSPTPAASNPPYFQTSGKYFRPPPNNPTAGVPGRRVLNLVIIDCSVPEVSSVGPGSKCAALPTLAVGKFFMTVPANISGKEFFFEFGGLVAPPLPPAEIRLYR